MEALVVLLVLALLAVPVLLVVALMSIGGLKQRVTALEDELRRSKARQESPPTTVTAASDVAAPPARPVPLRDPAPAVAEPTPSTPAMAAATPTASSL